MRALGAQVSGALGKEAEVLSRRASELQSAMEESASRRADLEVQLRSAQAEVCSLRVGAPTTTACRSRFIKQRSNRLCAPLYTCCVHTTLGSVPC